MSANTFLPPSPVVPPFLTISNITNTNPMVITVIETNNYVINQLIHLSIPNDYGMFQANQLTTQIIAINGLDFTVSLDGTIFDRFVNPPSGIEKPATLAPAGSRNLYNTLQVPFHSLGNFGN